jgi:hypothetical protein
MARVGRYVVLIEPFREFQNLFGRLHGVTSDYSSNLRENAERAGLEVIDFRPLGLGSVFNQSGILVGRSYQATAEAGAAEVEGDALRS